MAQRRSIRVRGVTYSSPDEARVAAEELRHHADTLAENLRRGGREGEADTVQDRGHADAARLQEWARERETAEAERTAQPPDAPPAAKPPRRRASAPKPRATRRRGTSSRPALTPRTRSLARQTGIPAQASSATSLALQVAGLTIGVAFLTLLVSDRGVAGFAGLANGLAGGLSWIVDPVDPLAPRPKPSSAPPSIAPASTAARSSSGKTTVIPLALGVG